MIKEIFKPKLKDPILITAWPGMGEVAYRTALFLKEALDFKIFAKLESVGFFKPAGVIIEKGILSLPSMPAGFFYYWKPKQGADIILFLGEAQPPLEYAQDLARAIISFCKKYKTKFAISFAAKPDPIDHKTDSKVWISVTHKTLLEQFKSFNLSVLKEGQISGLNGLVLGEAKRSAIKGICLLAQIPFYTVQIENPRANISILKVLDKLLRLKLDLNPLFERSQVIETEIDKLMSYLKGETSSPPPLNEDDIARIKKDLSTYTKLPESIRNKIESLFADAQRDIAKARELKEELDRWHVYPEFEDRFLDLFKKGKNTSN